MSIFEDMSDDRARAHLGALREMLATLPAEALHQIDARLRELDGRAMAGAPSLRVHPGGER